MNDLVLSPVASPAPVVEMQAVHEAVRNQLVEEIGADRLAALHTVVDSRTFTAALHWLSSARRSSVETKRRYTEDLTDFARWAAAHFGTAPVPLLETLSFEAVTAWTVYARSQKMAVRSQRRILSCVSSLFKDAMPRGWATSNPVSFQHHAPAVGKSTNGRPAGATRVLPPADTAKLAAAAQTPEEHLVFGLGYELGLRESEIVKLDADNLDRTVSPPVLTFERKRGQWRKRTVPPRLQPHLDAVLDGRTTGAVLLDPKTGERRNRHQIIDITRRLARHGGVPHPVSVTPHVLRASAITDLLNAGESAQEVQAWADHEHTTTTIGYWERANGLARDSALSAALAAWLDKAAAGIGGGR